MTSNHGKMSISCVKLHLRQNIEPLINELFSNKQVLRTPKEYRICSQGSVCIRRSDGSYYNHELGAGGDLITLIQHQLGIDFKRALDWARSFIGNASLPTILPSENLQKKYNEHAERKRDKALAILKRVVPIERTLAERYLREQRRISLSPLPISLGFVSHAYNYTASGFYPAMSAAIKNLTGEPIAVHCTFLDPKTGNKLSGDSIKPRLNFGAYGGGAIRLSDATERLALCEGIAHSNMDTGSPAGRTICATHSSRR